MATDCTRHWVQFFTGCGIPEDVAAIYGLIFNENRIQKNMLLDLNKEYLRDMGITVMGDVIAILRHAKVVHDNQVREQILHEPTENDVETDSLDDSQSQTKDLSPMKRMLEHYTRKYEANEKSIPHEKVQNNVNNEKCIAKKKAQIIGLNKRIDEVMKVEKLKLKRGNLFSKTLGTPMGKLRRVSPESEENYKMNVSSKVLEKSKRPTDKARLKQSKTVFERLGESSVSSSSDVLSISEQSQCIGKNAINKEKNTSVFSRLGEKSSVVSSTSPTMETDEHPDQLPYKGILKVNNVKKLGLSPALVSGTMRADSEIKLSKGNNNANRTDSIKERLGKNINKKESSIQKAGAKYSGLKITFDSDEEQNQVHTLANRFKSMKGASEPTKKNILDGIANRHDNTQTRPAVTSTTQSPEPKERILKRTVREIDRDIIDATQSKRVRFGRITERLIPSNNKDYRVIENKRDSNLTMTVLNGDVMLTKEPKQKTGIKVGSLSSDRMKRKVSMKERIGSNSVEERQMRRVVVNVKKNSPEIIKRLKKGINSSIHDRLG